MAVRAVVRKPAHRKPTKDGGGSFATVNSRRGFFRCRSAPNDEPYEARFVTSMNGSELQLKVRSRGCGKKADIAAGVLKTNERAGRLLRQLATHR